MPSPRGSSRPHRTRERIAMSADSNKKSARTFQCRDVLWGAFEQMAHDLECSIDYLINEAMKQYARQRSQDNARPAYVSPSREPSQPGTSSVPTAHAKPPAAAANPLPAAGRMAGAATIPVAPSRAPLPPRPRWAVRLRVERCRHPAARPCRRTRAPCPPRCHAHPLSHRRRMDFRLPPSRQRCSRSPTRASASP